MYIRRSYMHKTQSSHAVCMLHTPVCSIPQMSSVLSVVASQGTLNSTTLPSPVWPDPDPCGCALCKPHPHHLILSALQLPSDKLTCLHTHVSMYHVPLPIWIFFYLISQTLQTLPSGAHSVSFHTFPLQVAFKFSDRDSYLDPLGDLRQVHL